MLDIERQLCFLVHVLKEIELSDVLSLMKGSFSSWIWSNIGVPVGLFTSLLVINLYCRCQQLSSVGDKSTTLLYAATLYFSQCKMWSRNGYSKRFSCRKGLQFI